ncbi:unnamed protein product [Caenorhabditis brenneri]
MTNSFRIFLIVSLAFVNYVTGKRKMKKKAVGKKESSDEVSLNRNLVIAWVVFTIAFFLCSVILLVVWYYDRRRYKDKIRSLESNASTTTADSAPVVIHTMAASEVLVMKSDDEKVEKGGKQKAESKMEVVDDEETRKKKKKTKPKTKKKNMKKSKTKSMSVETTQEGERMSILSPNPKTKTNTARTPTNEGTTGKEETSADNHGCPQFQGTTTGGTDGTAGTAELQIASRRHF